MIELPPIVLLDDELLELPDELDVPLELLLVLDELDELLVLLDELDELLLLELLEEEPVPGVTSTMPDLTGSVSAI